MTQKKTPQETENLWHNMLFPKYFLLNGKNSQLKIYHRNRSDGAGMVKLLWWPIKVKRTVWSPLFLLFSSWLLVPSSILAKLGPSTPSLGLSMNNSNAQNLKASGNPPNHKGRAHSWAFYLGRIWFTKSAWVKVLKKPPAHNLFCRK